MKHGQIKGKSIWLAVLFTACVSLPSLRADDLPADPLLAYIPGPYLNPEGQLQQRRVLDERQTWEALRHRTAEYKEVWRWEVFEAEFGIKQRETSTLKSGLQLAKYQLDKSIFAVNEFVENVEEAVEFEYDFGRGDFQNRRRARRLDHDNDRVYFSPLRDAMENAKLKSDIDWNLGSSRAFLGLTLVVPFGD